MARVFVSHASDGAATAGTVHRWLVEAGHEVFLDVDRRDGIAAGELWRQRLHERLRWADAVVCVVTAGFRESRWCGAEVEIARSRGSRLLPLRAEPGVADPALESVQHIDLAPDPDAALTELTAVLRRVDAGGGLGWPDDRSPFPGLAAFDRDQRPVFFGRAAETKQLTELLRSPDVRDGDAALVVVGPSGCGKSSLVRAGLLPVIADEPEWWTLVPFVPGADPVKALSRELAAAARRIDLNWTVGYVRRHLDDGALLELVEELLVATPGGPRARLLVVVDQFEEVLTQCGPAERARFIEVLGPALAGPMQLMATLRSEFLDPLLSDPALAAVAARTYPVRPLGREGLRAVIEQPARLAGIEVDQALVDQLVEDTDSGDALPLLAFTLAQLADGICRGGQVSAARYDQLGGVRGALTRQADQALAAATTTTGRTRQEVIAGLLRLVTVDEQGRPTRWRIRRDELPTPVATELDAFVERRLLTTDDAHGSAIIGVTHEAFLSAWPPLHDAVIASATALRARRAIEHAATTWHDHRRSPDRLWTGGQLAAAITDTGAHTRPGPAPIRGPARWLPLRPRLLVTDRVDLSPTAHDFLYASIRRERYRRRRATTVLSTLLILALVGAGIAVIKQQDAQLQQRIAIARQLAAQAEAVRDSDPRTALQLGIAAQRIHPSDETKASLVSILTNTRYAGTLIAHTGPVYSAAFTADGHMLATGGSDGTVILWDLTDRSQPHRVGQPVPGADYSIALAADGHLLATAGGDGTVTLWGATDRNHPRQLGQLPAAHGNSMSAIALTADGQTLAAPNDDGTVTLWDLTDPGQPHRLDRPLTGAEYVIAFTADGQILATLGRDSTVTLWDLTDPNQPHRLGRPVPGADYGGALAADGRTLATTGVDATVTLWDLTDRNHPRRIDPSLTSPSDAADWVALTADGRTLASANFDSTVALWDLTDRNAPRRLGGQPLSGRPVAFTADGHTLATTGGDNTVALWDLTDGNGPRRLGQPLNEAGYGMVFTADGHTLATADTNGMVTLWNLTDPNAPRRLGQPFTNPDYSLFAFTADGHTVATVDIRGMVTLWDLTDRNHPRRLGGQPISGQPVAFTADGYTLATANSDGTVILWDITDRNGPRRVGQPFTSHFGFNPAMGQVKGAFTANGHTLALATSDGAGYNSGESRIVLWDLTDRNSPRQLGHPLTFRTSQLDAIAIAVDGHTLATTGSDGTVVLWDLTDRNQPRRLGQSLAGGGKSVEFTPDGYTLAAADAAGTVTLWDLSGLDDLRDHTVTRACSITGRGLDRDGWDRYASGLPYQETCP